MLTASFFTLALGRGLTAAIMNPHAPDMMRAYHSYLALTGQDERFARYIAFAEREPKAVATAAGAPEARQTTASDLQGAIAKGLKERAPWCKVMVGGAVLTKDYAAAIGADCYAKDAMAGVRYAEEIDLALKK